MLLPSIALLAFLKQAAPPYQVDSASKLVHQCEAYKRMTDGSESEPDIQAGLQCISYIDGFEDATEELCIPPATLETLARVYLAYMDKHPKEFDSRKGESLRHALSDAYPCPVKFICKPR